MTYNAYFEYDNGQLYAKEPRYRVKSGKKIGSLNNCGYVQLTFKNKTTLAHRIIWEMHNGTIPEGYDIDHINKVRTDNRIQNLRLLTVAENRSGGIAGVPKPEVQCPHCGSIGGKPVMTRWHFDNCKQREIAGDK